MKRRRRRLRVLLDVDEVLALFHPPAFDLIEMVTGRRYQAEEIDAWDIFSVLNEEQKKAVNAEIEKPGWCSRLKVAPGAQEAVRELRTMADVYPVTSPYHSVPWVKERADWLNDLFGWKPTEIVHTGAKFLVSGDALVDDNPYHIDTWSEEHPDALAMLWDIPNTRRMPYDLVRVSSWVEMLVRVDRHRRLVCP